MFLSLLLVSSSHTRRFIAPKVRNLSSVTKPIMSEIYDDAAKMKWRAAHSSHTVSYKSSIAPIPSVYKRLSQC